MKQSIRQRWDCVNDRPDFSKPDGLQEYKLWNAAVAKAIPEFCAKLVKLPHGQSEISVTPVNILSVINARMGFNPLLDCPRRENFDDEERARRDEENRQRSAKRAKQTVRHLVKSIFADHMLTFTYRENVTDRKKVAKDWKEFVRLFRLRHPEWAYLAVIEKQERGAYHIHAAVAGKQDIRWLLRCWLIAIGQPPEDVSQWLIKGVKLGQKSFGAVNVEPPKRRWGGTAKHWKRDKLAGYLTKYIGKDFDEAEKNRKKYWHSRNIPKPEITRFWLKADNYLDAVREAHDLIYFTGACHLSMWGDHSAGVIWITGETDRKHIGQCTQAAPDFDFLAD